MSKTARVTISWLKEFLISGLISTGSRKLNVVRNIKLVVSSVENISPKIVTEFPRSPAAAAETEDWFIIIVLPRLAAAPVVS